MALFTDKWVRVFDIPETSNNIKGFTLYKIVSIVYPKTCPDAVTKVTVWKRYNDFKKLHRDLKHRHKSMHIEDKFPSLVASSYFKRFDPEIINQRKNSTLLFLEYVALHPPLFKSTDFVKFFETSHTPQESLNSNINIIRAQLNLPNEPEIVYSYNSDDEHSDSDTISTFSSVSASFNPVDESIHLDRSVSCHTNFSETLSSASKVSSPDSLSNQSCKNVTVVDGLSTNLYPTPPSTPESVLNLEEYSSAQYLTTAAELITKASEYELTNKFNEAFVTYKNGISCLLDGVKGDTDVKRRQIIRHNVEKYLLRAEKIYNLHLSPEITQLKNLCKISTETSSFSIRRPIEDLLHYKVLKIIQSGMVVLHKKEHNVFYLKVIQKGPQVSDLVYLNIPKDVPYMVKLFQYYDSLNAIFIVTEYINGGKLFDYIKQKNMNSSAQFSPITFEKDVQLLDREFDDMSSDSSECSYLELINAYTKKTKSINADLDPAPKCSAIFKQKSRDESSSSLNSQVNNEDSSSHTEIQEKLDIVSNVDGTSKFSKPFQRKISEKSFTEEFSSVGYIPPIENIVKWSAQLLLAIDKLHKIGIVICDLTPRNLLIDEKGNLLLTFMCNFREKAKLFSNKYENRFYCAPEVYGLQHVTYAADWWSYGSILFELLTGMPLSTVHPEGMHNYTILKIPKYVSPEGKSLLRQLLVYEPHERLEFTVLFKLIDKQTLWASSPIQVLAKEN
ncbi:uncharacterized protein CBL_08202 [Carabus blaptoides fortunei]